MLYTILCTFRPGAFAEAKKLRLEHYEFLRRVKSQIVEGGPLVGPDGVPASMLIVVDMESPEAAPAFISEEPHTKNGLFESVTVRRWNHVIPEPASEYIENEYRKEMATRPPDEAIRRDL
ncbi:MAG: YciI family protein [Bryobacteraceae bacterium]|nr:YciI family protein [Bryobacteraceae bacterium]